MGEWRTIQHGQASVREYEMRAEDGRGPRMLRPVQLLPELPQAKAPEALGEGEPGGPRS